MYIKKELVIEAIFYDKNSEKVLEKFPNLSKEKLETVTNGNYIIVNNDNTFYTMNPQEFNKAYIEIKQVINNYTTTQISQRNKETKTAILTENNKI